MVKILPRELGCTTYFAASTSESRRKLCQIGRVNPARCRCGVIQSGLAVSNSDVGKDRLQFQISRDSRRDIDPNLAPISLINHNFGARRIRNLTGSNWRIVRLVVRRIRRSCHTPKNQCCRYARSCNRN